jgi:hypothetical protein
VRIDSKIDHESHPPRLCSPTRVTEPQRCALSWYLSLLKSPEIREEKW